MENTKQASPVFGLLGKNPMIKAQEMKNMLLLPVILFGFLATSFIMMTAQAVAVPANATANTYGESWECNEGYREINKFCVAIERPKNAYLTNRSYDRGWACSYGYRELNNACIVFEVPKNAFLNSAGDDWE
jgi:hypothetical protein